MNVESRAELHAAQLTGKVRTRRRITFAMWAACLLSIFLILLALSMPAIRQNALISQLEQRGAVINRVYEDRYGEVWLSDTLQQTVGVALPLTATVIGADFTQARFDDETFTMISRWNELEYLLLINASISPANLKQFVASKPALNHLLVINCNQITPSDVRDLEAAHPKLRVEYRGTAFLGIRGETLPSGCIVVYIKPGSAAQTAGLQFADLITHFDGMPISSFDELVRQIANKQPEDIVELTIIRDTVEMVVPCELGSWTEDASNNPAPGPFRIAPP